MTTVVGLDFGTRRIAYAIPSLTRWGILELKANGKHAVLVEDAGRHLAEWLTEEMSGVPSPFFYAERPFVGRPHGNVRTAIGQALTVGGVLAQLPGPCSLIEQAEWKKAVVGSGNASKQQVSDWLTSAHPASAAACLGNQDLIDATCIALYGVVLRGGVP